MPPPTPSPNAGVAEAAVAAALGLELGGPLRYGDRQEIRPRLGSGPRPQPADIVRAINLVDRTERLLIGALLAGVVASALRRRR
jgi:adenosylcobinamide-phosphate synthase